MFSRTAFQAPSRSEISACTVEGAGSGRSPALGAGAGGGGEDGIADSVEVRLTLFSAAVTGDEARGAGVAGVESDNAESTYPTSNGSSGGRLNRGLNSPRVIARIAATIWECVRRCA